MYSLKSVTGASLQAAFQRFHIKAGGLSTNFYTNFDNKLIQGECRQYLDDNNVCVAAAPSGHQSQNGLLERAWQTTCNMARAFITEMQMPKCFWYWAVCHAAQINNYMPHLQNGVLISSFELVHGQKPDLCNLFWLFSTGYFVHTCNNKLDRTTMEAQSLQGVAVGKNNESDSMMFYCPFNQQVYTTQYCTLDKNRHTATAFNSQYNGGIFIGLYSSAKRDPHSSPPELYPPGTEVSFQQQDRVHIRGSVLSLPVKHGSHTPPIDTLCGCTHVNTYMTKIMLVTGSV
eukprot:6351901-Ditylum_brightwellii.AAC.1